MADPATVTIITLVAAIAGVAVGFVQVTDILVKRIQNRRELKSKAAKARLLADISSMMGTESFPVFDGNDYETWRNMMKRLLIIYDLWGLVEKGYKTKAFRKSRKKKDSLAVEIILLAVDDSVRRCTLNANNSKQVWDAIQNKYHQVSRLSLSEQVDPSQDDAEDVGLLLCQSRTPVFTFVEAWNVLMKYCFALRKIMQMIVMGCTCIEHS